MSQWNARNLPEAESRIEQATRADRRWPEPWRALAELRHSKWLSTGSESDWDAFTAAADSLAQRDPRHHLTYYTRGNWLLSAWRKSGRPELLEQARAEYARAIERYPNRALYHAQLAWALHLAGRAQEARAAAETAKQLDDRNPHKDQKLREHKIVDPQIAADGQLTLQHADSAEQIALRLRTTSGSRDSQENAP